MPAFRQARSVSRTAIRVLTSTLWAVLRCPRLANSRSPGSVVSRDVLGGAAVISADFRDADEVVLIGNALGVGAGCWARFRFGTVMPFDRDLCGQCWNVETRSEGSHWPASATCRSLACRPRSRPVHERAGRIPAATPPSPQGRASAAVACPDRRARCEGPSGWIVQQLIRARFTLSARVREIVARDVARDPLSPFRRRGPLVLAVTRRAGGSEGRQRLRGVASGRDTAAVVGPCDGGDGSRGADA